MQNVIISKLISSNRVSSHTGLSIWLPDMTDMLDGKIAYGQLTFSRATKWDELIERVTQARGYVTLATTPVSGPYTGFDVFVSPMSSMPEDNWTVGQPSELETGLVVKGGSGFVITDLPITEEFALGVRLKRPVDWVSPPRWRIEVGPTFALYRDVYFPSFNQQTDRSGWHDRENIDYNWWFPFKVTPDGDVSIINKSFYYGL